MGGAPNFTISDLSNVRVGFLSRSFRARGKRTQADSGFFTQLFAAFGITFLSSFVFLQSFRVWRYVRSLYKLMSFLVPPKKSCLHCTCSNFASTTARLLIFVSRPKTSLDHLRLEMEIGDWRLEMEIGDWR